MLSMADYPRYVVLTLAFLFASCSDMATKGNVTLTIESVEVIDENVIETSVRLKNNTNLQVCINGRDRETFATIYAVDSFSNYQISDGWEPPSVVPGFKPSPPESFNISGGEEISASVRLDRSDFVFYRGDSYEFVSEFDPNRSFRLIAQALALDCDDPYTTIELFRSIPSKSLKFGI